MIDSTGSVSERLGHHLPFVVTPTETVELVRDPDDNRLIEAALAAAADIIVTGDRDLLTLGRVDPIRILTPRDFLEALPPDT